MTLGVWTIGHSTRTLAEFERALVAHGIEVVVDVRRFPGSRRLPQFESSALDDALARIGIAYRWIPELGGRRRATEGLVDSAWRHPAFRAYADHVLTQTFADGLAELLTIAHGMRSAIMCAEILWWRCHRRLVADVLTALDIEVIHIRDESHADVHRLALPARLVRGKLTYAPEPG